MNGRPCVSVVWPFPRPERASCGDGQPHRQLCPRELVDVKVKVGRSFRPSQPGEYRLDGHVDGSSNIAAFTWEHGFHLPNELFAEEVAAAHDTAETLILLCADGRLSQGAAAVLEAAAFSQVLSLAGGLRAWEADAEDEGSGVPPLVVDEDGEGGLTSAWV